MPFIFRRILPSGKQLPLIATLLIVYIVWGTTYHALNVAMQTMPPLLMNGARFLLAGLVMLGLARWQGLAWPSAQQWRYSALIGGLMAFGAWFIPRQVEAENKVKRDQEEKKVIQNKEAEKDSVKSVLKTSEIELALGKLVSTRLLGAHQELAFRVGKMRKKFASQYGFVVPEIKVTDDIAIQDKSYQIRIHGTTIASNSLRVGEVLDRVDQCGTHRLGGGHMRRHATAEEGALPLAPGPVEVLLGHGQIAGPDLQRQAADRRKTQQLGGASLLERKDVGPVVHLVRQQAVARTVAGQEQHRVVPQPSLEDLARGLAEGRRRLQPAFDLESGQFIEAGASHDGQHVHVSCRTT